jgi:hypothetical protein
MLPAVVTGRLAVDRALPAQRLGRGRQGAWRAITRAGQSRLIASPRSPRVRIVTAQAPRWIVSWDEPCVGASQPRHTISSFCCAVQLRHLLSSFNPLLLVVGRPVLSRPPDSPSRRYAPPGRPGARATRQPDLEQGKTLSRLRWRERLVVELVVAHPLG